MRLTYIHNAEIPSRGASTVQVMRMCSALVRLGCDVELIVPHYGEQEPLSGEESLSFYGCTDRFSLHRIRLGKGRWFGFARTASKRAADRKSEIVFGRCVRSCAASAWRGLRVMHESHGPMEAYARSGRWAFRWLARSPHFLKLVVINQALAKYYQAVFPALSSEPLVAPSGTDPVEGAKPLVAAPLKGKLRIGYVGSLFPGKGMELIAEIAKRTSHEFIVIGGDDALVDEWKTRTGDNVTFLGFLPNREVGAQIEQFNIALAPYGKEVSGGGTNFNLAAWMSPLKLFEYMAYARTIIASDLPAIREVVTDGVEVVLCDPQDPDEWARAIERLAQDQGLREGLGRRALDTFLQGYTWEKRARKILDAAGC